MAVVVAGLFDEQADATKAMDVLLRQNIEGLDTHVIEGQGRWAGQNSESGGVAVPLVPNTGNNMGTGGIGTGGGAFVPFGGNDTWMRDMDEVERAFYYEGMREGATLALARVDDEHAEHVRQLLRQHGARTYVED